MTTISVAEKKRLAVPGIQNGARYVVRREAGGWRIEPAPKKNSLRNWKGPAMSLSKHFQRMKRHGLTKIERLTTPVPPCPF